jgi:hypothetical protein
MSFASIVRKMRVGNREVLQLKPTSALLVDSIWRPFRARRSGRRFPGLKPSAESCSPFGAGSLGLNRNSPGVNLGLCYLGRLGPRLTGSLA